MFRITFEQSDPSPLNPGAFMLRVTATDQEDPPVAQKIFVMREALEPGVADQFSCVASVPQMNDLAEDAAGEGSPFYRTDIATIVLRTAAAAADLQTDILTAVEDLNADIVATAQFGTPQVFNIP